MIKPELLAPAGNIESLKLAVYNGADAVYLGLNKFNARFKADNFNEQNLKENIEFAHLFGVKVYIAFNTLIKNNEINDFIELLDIAVNANADAFIVQSLSIARLIKSIYPNAVLHASTQMGIHNRYGASLCKDEGFSRVILSRECTLEDIIDIKNNVDIELEAFIHGALCVSFSGGCYMSSFISCNSGNRGQCLQPCRLPYKAYFKEREQKNGYLLSLSDLCLEKDINKLVEAGITSLKIEGRMRRPEYTGEVTAFYRKIIDNQIIYENDFYNIKALYNRGGFTKGYYFSSNENINSIKHQGHMGVKIGTVKKVDKDVLEVESIKKLDIDDGFKLFDNDIEIGNAIFYKSCGNNIYQLKYKGKAIVGTDVNITTDNLLSMGILSRRKFLAVKLKIQAYIDRQFTMTAEYDKFIVSATSNYTVQKSINCKLSNDAVMEKLGFFGDYFKADNIEFFCDENIFLPLSVVNNLKREIAQKLKEKILNRFEKTVIKNDTAFIISGSKKINKNKEKLEIKKVCIISNSEYLAICKDCYAVILRPAEYTKNIINDFCKSIKNIDDKIFDKLYLLLPPLCNVKDLKVLEDILTDNKFSGLYINNPYGIYLAKKYGLKIFCGTGMNIFNDLDVNFVENFCKNYVLSFELSKAEVNNIKEINNSFVFAYGYIDLMTISACMYKPVKEVNCKNCDYKGDIVLKDKINESFYLKRYKISKCYFNVVNGKKLNIFKKELPQQNLIFNFTDESLQTAQEIYNLKTVAKGNFTGGHFNRSTK